MLFNPATKGAEGMELTLMFYWWYLPLFLMTLPILVGWYESSRGGAGAGILTALTFLVTWGVAAIIVLTKVFL
jgi:hypothetical protein